MNSARLSAPAVSAASNSNVLKSRPFRGRELTDSLDSFSPPVAFPLVVSGETPVASPAGSGAIETV